MKVSEIICEGTGIDQHIAPELLQQQVNQIIDAIKAGGYLLTDADKALLDYARKQKIYHPDEIANNKFHKSIIASVKPLLKKIEQLWSEPRDITSDVEAIIGEPILTLHQKIKPLLANPNRQPMDYVVRANLTQLLIAAACPKNNGTWDTSTAKCYSNNYPWILDQVKEKYRAKDRKRRANMTPDEREEVQAKDREYQQQRRDTMTPAEREEYLAYDRERKRNRLANMSPAEREEYRAKHREYYQQWTANMSPAKREEYLAKKRERQQRRKAKKK